MPQIWDISQGWSSADLGHFPIVSPWDASHSDPMNVMSARQLILDEIARQQLSVAEAARRAGVKYDVIRDLKRGKAQTTSWENVRKIADGLGLALPAEAIPTTPIPSVATGGRGETVMVPVYDVRASAGSGLIPDDYVSITDQVSFALEFIRRVLRADPNHLAMITVWGDSMEPTLISGDLVFMNIAETRLDVEGIFVFRHDGAVHVKRMIRSAKPGHVLAIPDNDYYPRQEYPIDEVTVIGKVVYFAGMVRPRIAR